MEVKDMRFETHHTKIDLFGTNNNILYKNRL